MEGGMEGWREGEGESKGLLRAGGSSTAERAGWPCGTALLDRCESTLERARPSSGQPAENSSPSLDSPRIVALVRCCRGQKKVHGRQAARDRRRRARPPSWTQLGIGGQDRRLQPHTRGMQLAGTSGAPARSGGGGGGEGGWLSRRGRGGGARGPFQSSDTLRVPRVSLSRSHSPAPARGGEGDGSV